MPDSNQEIYVALLAGIVLALLLVGFIVAIFFLYQQKRKKQEQEMVTMKDRYEQELLRSQLEIQEATLKGIAQELHDNMGQVLSVVKLWLASLPLEKDHPAYEGLQDSRQMLNKVIFDMSDLTKSLHTDRITDIGLVEAIRFDVATLQKAGMVDFNFTVSGEEFQFEGQKSIFLFRIYQEMTNNILKHSKATHVNISIIYSTNDTFVLKVQDDGVGFDPNAKKATQSSSSGLGLKNMLNRAQLIGATVQIESEPGKGTTITIEMPNAN
ncbi:MAG TPA: sensor histidine kinase [Puia sp.]|nr:sensor histidine kinase [Puia sp.]